MTRLERLRDEEDWSERYRELGEHNDEAVDDRIDVARGEEHCIDDGARERRVDGARGDPLRVGGGEDARGDGGRAATGLRDGGWPGSSCGPECRRWRIAAGSSSWSSQSARPGDLSGEDARPVAGDHVRVQG